MTSRTTLVMLGPLGTRWLFLVVVASALAAWASETLQGVIDVKERIGLPCIALAFATLAWLSWRRPQRLHQWQRWGVSLLAVYFTGGMLFLTLRPDPGPSLYALASLAPWTLAASLLLFTTWRAGTALAFALGLLVLMLAPAALLRFAGRSPAWLVEAWPLLANLALCQTMFCLGLWGVSSQLARLTRLAPAAKGLATADDLVRARVAELERSRAAAETASRAKSDFLANIGHEIRTPMNTILGQTRLLLDSRLPAAQHGQLQAVAGAGESLVKLIDGLLDYADLDAGRMRLAQEPLRLEQLLDSAFEAVRPAAQAKQLELLFEMTDTALLGPAGARRGDAVRLTQLITELLVNAVKFTPSGQVKLTVGLTENEAWRLRVRDSGVGLTAEQLARLFTPFAQAEAGATRRFGGTGLGLAICRALAERMGGSLTARSPAGRGSEFELVLPLPPCPDLPPPALAQLRSALLVQAPHSAGHEALVNLLRALAPTTRLEVLTQGGQALGRIARTPPGQPHDLLIVDWVLPDMEGVELLRRLAAAGSLSCVRRIVLLSAFDTPVLRARALGHGAHALAPKPLLPHTLRRLLDMDRSLPTAPVPLEMARMPEPPSTDAAMLITELDTLLGESDSHALTLWEQHGSAFIDMLPAAQAKALAGAMQRFDFDEAQAVLRGESKR